MRSLTEAERLSLGQTLRTRRELNGLNQTALAEAIDCDQTTVSRIELGRTARPDPVVIIDAARLLGLNPVALLITYYDFNLSDFDVSEADLVQQANGRKPRRQLKRAS
jgi:transcriptional regulator with XRE-family HTH domain